MDNLSPVVPIDDEVLKRGYELELVPIARAMTQQDVKEARKIRPSWAMRAESLKAYATLQNTPDDQLMTAFASLMQTDAYMQGAIRNIGDAPSTKDIGEWMRKQWVKRLEVKYVKKLLDAEDEKDKATYVSALRGLYHQSSPEAYVVDMSNPSPPVDFLMTYEGVSYRPRGDIAVIKAKAKSGKSSFLRIEIAAMISTSGQVNGMSRSFVPGTEEIRPPYRVLWIDTEQSHADSDKDYRQVLQMAGYPLDKNVPNLKLVNLRMMDSKDRLERVEEETTAAIWDVVVLDGVRDVAKNINDPLETDEVMSRILQLIEDTKVAFITIIHENPATETDKMRGWIGTELGNKAFEIQAVKSNKDTGVFTVSNPDRRGKMIPAYGFMYDEDDKLVQTDPEAKADGHEQGQNRSRKDMLVDNQTRYCNQVKKAFEDNPALSCSHADLIRLLIKKCGLTDTTARNRIKTAHAAGVLKVVEGEAMKRGAVYALTPQEQTNLNILLTQNATINEDGTIPDIFDE